MSVTPTSSSLPPAAPRAVPRWALRALLVMIVVVAIARIPWVWGGHDAQAVRLRGQLDTTRAELRARQAANARLAGEVEALRTDVTAIEAHARDELGLVYPGELVLRLEPTP